MKPIYILFLGLSILMVSKISNSYSENDIFLEKSKGYYSEVIEYQGNTYHIFGVHPDSAELRFFYKNEKNQRYKSLSNLKKALDKKGEKLLMATNGGIFSTTREPLGLYIENGKWINQMNLKEGKGNFFWKENGVFYFGKNGNAGVVESGRFLKSKISFENAVQSGPMLVIDGEIHQGFDKSTSKYTRSGVGVQENGMVIFAISTNAVRFYDFADLYKSHFKCQNALYLDGAISKMYLPELNKEVPNGNFSTLIGVVE
jgi:uncharacterized protein YigE (DUF2233 family)